MLSTPESLRMPAQTTGTTVFVTLVVWFSTVFGLGVAGLLGDPPIPVVPLGLFGSIVAMVLLHRKHPSLRSWLAAIDTRVLVGWHVLRAPIGVWFLMAYQRGELPGELALLAGWGDIASGLGAALLLVPGLGRPKLVGAWNVLAMLDIVMVVGTAQKILLFDGGRGFASGIGFPFLLLPWFVVPLVVVTHLALFARLRRGTL